MNNKPLINKHNFNNIFKKCPSVFQKIVCESIDFPEEVKDYHIITRSQLGLCNENEETEGNLFLIINDEYIIEVSLIDENDDYDIEEDRKKIMSFIMNLNKDYDKYKYLKINFDRRPNANVEPIINYNYIAGVKTDADYITKDDIDIYITKS